MMIGISGYAQSGKDTLCEELQKVNSKFTRFAFADDMKLISAALIATTKRAERTSATLQQVIEAAQAADVETLQRLLQRLFLVLGESNAELFQDPFILPPETNLEQLLARLQDIQTELPTSGNVPLTGLDFRHEPTKKQHRDFIIAVAETVRVIQQDFWAKAAVQKAIQAEKMGLVPVFTDLRFKNEAKELRKQAATVIRVECNEAELIRRGWNPKLKHHVSESDLIGYDFDAYFHSDVLTPEELRDEAIEFLASNP